MPCLPKSHNGDCNLMLTLADTADMHPTYSSLLRFHAKQAQDSKLHIKGKEFKQGAVNKPKKLVSTDKPKNAEGNKDQSEDRGVQRNGHDTVPNIRMGRKGNLEI